MSKESEDLHKNGLLRLSSMMTTLGDIIAAEGATTDAERFSLTVQAHALCIAKLLAKAQNSCPERSPQRKSEVIGMGAGLAAKNIAEFAKSLAGIDGHTIAGSFQTSDVAGREGPVH